jgi:16S rRNA (cytidine1402-2'-O)-methyltransferase
MTKFYLVPTPIGNLGDITHRAIEVLKSCDLILAEDTRKSSILLKHYDINRPLRPFHKFNEHKAIRNIINELLTGKIIALISDAGTPGISDPGFLIVRECKKEGIEVECLPGATAIIPALVQSGFPTDRFCFEGFLPQKKGRQKKLTELKDESRTMVFFESPYRLMKTLEQFKEFFGAEREASVSRELTKIYEENISGTLDSLIEHFKEKQVKGEIVIVVMGSGK